MTLTYEDEASSEILYALSAILTEPQVRWDHFFALASFRAIEIFGKPERIAGEDIYLVTGFTDRLLALARLNVYATRRKLLDLRVIWVVNEACGCPCPPTLIEMCQPAVIITNNTEFFQKQRPIGRTYALAIADPVYDGRVCFGQAIEPDPLNADEDLKPFFGRIREALGIRRDPGSFAIHIRGGDWLQLHDRSALVIPDSLKARIRDRRVVLHSDDREVAQAYSIALRNIGIEHETAVPHDTAAKHSATVRDFCQIACCEAVFFAFSEAGKFAKVAAITGDVRELYEVVDGRLTKTNSEQLLEWYSAAPVLSVQQAEALVRFWIRRSAARRRL